MGSCQINIHFAPSTFYHPLCFIEITGPLHFPFLQFCAASSGLPSASAEVVFLMVGITAVYCDLQGLVHFCPKNASEISLPMAQWQHQSQLRGLVFGLLVCAFCLIGRAAAVWISGHWRLDDCDVFSGWWVVFSIFCEVIPLACMTNVCKEPSESFLKIEIC